jgi:hypothetical protein
VVQIHEVQDLTSWGVVQTAWVAKDIKLVSIRDNL